MLHLGKGFGTKVFVFSSLLLKWWLLVAPTSSTLEHYLQTSRWCFFVFMRREALAVEHERRRQEEVARLRSEARCKFDVVILPLASAVLEMDFGDLFLK